MTAEKTKAELVRERFRARRADSVERVIRIPFVVDQELADKAEQLARQHDELEGRIEKMIDYVDSLDSDDLDSDVRADGTDLTAEHVTITALQDSLDKVKAELEEAVEQVKDGSAWLHFRLATAGEYQQHLAEVERDFGKLDGSNETVIAFGDKLTNLCFLRVEHDGEDLGYSSWAEFVDDMKLTFGDLEPIRAAIVARNRASGAFKLPFSLAR